MKNDCIIGRTSEALAFLLLSASLSAYFIIYWIGLALKGQRWDSEFLFPISMLSLYIFFPILIARRLSQGKGVRFAFWYLIAISPLMLGMASVSLSTVFIPIHLPIHGLIVTVLPVIIYGAAIFFAQSRDSCSPQAQMSKWKLRKTKGTGKQRGRPFVRSILDPSRFPCSRRNFVPLLLRHPRLFF
jgi:hypothetical protein